MPRNASPLFLLLPLLSVATIAFADAGVAHHGSTTTIGDDWAYGSSTSDDAGTDEFSFAVLSAGSHASVSLSDLDFVDDVDDLQKEADKNGTGMFWFRLDDKSYRVRDHALVKEALAAVKPMVAAGREQGEYGAKMGELGAKMGELGALQGRMGALRAQLAIHRIGGDDADRADLDRLERELDDMQSDLRELRAEQREMGRQQKALGAEQKKLGKKSAATAKQAQKDLRALAERAIREGKAERDL